MKLFDADGEVRVGDIVRYGNKPHIVEKINQGSVTIVTMSERKYTFQVLPEQIKCVFEKEDWA